jgi:hypothetical protein
LGEALGKGAGPVIGSIIGTALLGPLGGIIGGMIGSMEGITKPLGQAFDSIVNSFEPLASVVGSLLGIIGDAAAAIAGLFGADSGSGFSGLAVVLEPVVKLFQLLEIGIRGLAVALKYVRMIIAEWSGTEEEKLKARREYYGEDKKLKAREGEILAKGNMSVEKRESERARLWKEYNEKLARENSMSAADAEYYKSYMATSKIVLEGEYKKQIEQKKSDAALKGLSAERKKAIEEEIRVLQTKLAALKGERPPTKKTEPSTTTPPTPGTPKPGAPTNKPTKPIPLHRREAKVDTSTDAGLAKLGKWLTTPFLSKPPNNKPTSTGAGGATSIPKDLQKTAQTPAAVKAGTDKTTNAVKELTAKITSQSSLQTSVAAIYNLMASGMLRVQTNMVGMMGTQGRLPGPGESLLPPPSVIPPGGLVEGADYSTFWRAKGGLGDAVASEMKHKPAGSSLVVANSSETVIPAAGGHGMLDFVETLRAGFSAMIATYKETQTRQDNTLKTIKNTLVSNQMQTNARLQKLETKFTSPSMPGGLGGAAAGGVDAFTPIAQRMGLSMTSGYRPGDSGWHGANRARDFSNGSGPTPQMMQFAQYMASTYGANLKELIYTPLGFSIKNGQKVAPYAQGAHMNHVHVAYALGPEDGRMFSELGGPHGAQAWEKSMVPGSVKVASITGNSREGFGETNITNNMNITQLPGEDGEALANRVATLFWDAATTANSSKIF